MSLSPALNNPTLISSLGVASMYSFLELQKVAQAGGITFAVLKGTNLFAYLIQTYAVSRPGRIDDAVAQGIAKEEQQQQSESQSSSTPLTNSNDDNSNRNDDNYVSEALLPASGRTLVAPAGWAFAIWGPIFLGEAIFVVSQLFIEESSKIAPLLRSISIPFTFAHVFQTLWTAAFRPKYKKNLQYISAALLGSTAFALSKAHAMYAPGSSTALNVYSMGQYWLYLFPMSLHFGWTTAATLVGINGAFVANPNASSKSIAVLGHLSVLVATALGVFVSVDRMAPVYGGVISWALFAVSDGMKKRMQTLLSSSSSSQQNENAEDSVEYKSAKTQNWLSRAGAWICAATSAAVLVSSFISK